MLLVNTINFFCRIFIKMEFSSQRVEMLLFLTTAMAAVTSRGIDEDNSFNNPNRFYLVILSLVLMTCLCDSAVLFKGENRF